MSHKVFEIQVPEIWVQTYFVRADNKEEAIDRIYRPKGIGGVVEGELELSHSKDIKDWEVKELTQEEIPECLKL